jgi:hypothetical protein
MQQQGYQSWSFSGATTIPAKVPMGTDGSISAKAAASGLAFDEVAGVSYGTALIGNPGTTSIAVGATSFDVGTTAIAAVGAGTPTITVLYGASREALPAVNGQVKTSEIVFALGSGNEALAKLAGEIKKAQPATLHSPKRPPGGWFSWNQLFDKVTEDDIKAHADLVATNLLPKGLPLVEIDSGWYTTLGDWTANTKFSSGMDAVAKIITQKGLQAGIWYAPFLVDVTSQTGKTADPSLFVKGTDGTPLQHQPTGDTAKYFILDGTNPDSMKLVTDSISALAKAGFTYFKFDFLYAGALPGIRKDTTATGTQALQRGMDTIRSATGDSAIINACGAPIFPLIGHSDSLRIGTDAAYSSFPLTWADIAAVARSTAARSFLSPLVWLDGDQTQVRDPYTLDEARVSAFSAALSGPAYALGDDLRTLPAERLAIVLDPQVIDLAGAEASALPADPLESPVASVVINPVLDGMAHPGATAAPPPTKFTMKGKSGTTYQLNFNWTTAHSVTVTQQ